MLPDVPDAELLKALQAVVASGWHLADHDKQRAVIEPLVGLAHPQPTEDYFTIVRRVQGLIGASLDQDGIEALNLDESMESQDRLVGLRILLGLHPYYREVLADQRRREASGLIFPTRGTMEANTFFKTWQKRALELVISCLRFTYGQAMSSTGTDFQVISRKSSGVVGDIRRFRKVDSFHVVRSMKDHLTHVSTRIYRIEKGAEVTYTPLQTVGAPEVRHDRRYRWLVFPLLHPASMGEVIYWSYRRSYRYPPDLPKRKSDRLVISSPQPGFGIEVDIEFQEEVPPVIWKVATPSLNIPGLPTEESLVKVNDRGLVRFPRTDQTMPGNSYGLAWRWEPQLFE